MKVVLEHMTEVSGSERKVGCLPEMCMKSPVQLGAFTSESFSGRITNSANLLVDAHRLKFGDDVIDKLIVLCMDKKFMDAMRSKTTFATMTFETMDANKRIKV